MRYVISLKKEVDEKDAGDWKLRVIKTPGVMLVRYSSPVSDKVTIDAGFDAYTLLLHQLGKICNIEKESKARFDI